MDKNNEIAQRMRGIREIKEMTASQVAEKIGIPLGEYEEYEAGEKELHVSVMYDFCALMDIDLTELITGKSPKLSQYTIVRKGHGVGTDRNKAYEYHNLAYNFTGRKLEPFMVVVEPNEEDEIPLSVHQGHEYHYCVEGRFIMKIGDHEMVVEEGDSVYFQSRYPHGMKALDGKPVKILVIIV